MQEVTFDVPAISCEHCIANIRRVVTNEVPGVTDVKGDHEKKCVTIVFDTPATVDAIVGSMTEWDYPPAL